MNETLVKVEGVSKKFCRSLKKSLWYGMQDLGREITGRKHPANAELRPDEFWAVKNVSFELKRGECLGLIGHNGAGKTTLLKMLNGLIKPDSGRIEMRGRIGALIALGAGFNPILSGRENIYVNGSVLGLSKCEIDNKINDIIDFAEIREFIDAPVQTYSSGMQMRLGFAIATTIQPDILILDEVLAVGDAAFRAKCFNRIGQVASRSAIIFVSHDQSQISRICDRAILLDKGLPKYKGNTVETIELYSQSHNISATEASTLITNEAISKFSLKIVDHKSNENIISENSIKILISFFAEQSMPAGICLIGFTDSQSNLVGQADITGQFSEIPAGKINLIVQIPNISLATGKYNINFALFSSDKRTTLIQAVACAQINLVGMPYFWCAYKIPALSTIVRTGDILIKSNLSDDSPEKARENLREPLW